MQMNGQGAKAWEELTEHIPKKVILRLFWMMWFILHQVFLQAQFQVVDLKFWSF
jgi:hypothetical protein